MRTNPPDSVPGSVPGSVPDAVPTLSPEPQRLHREAVLVVWDRGRMALLTGLCTLAGVVGGFALATVTASDRAATPPVCEPPPLPPAGPSPPIQAQPAPMPYGGGGGHGHGHGHRWHGPWPYWPGPFDIDIDINRSAPRAWLGVTTVMDPAGAKVTAVAPGSPAATAGLAAGDVITEVDGEQIATSAQLSTVVGDLDPGEKVAIHVLRAGKPVTLPATVVDRP